MNLFNRFLGIIVFLVLTGLIVGALLVMYGAELVFLNGYLAQERNYLGSLEGWQLVVGTISAVFLILLFFILFLLEIPRPKPDKDLLISSGEKGLVTMSRSSLEEFAESVGMQVAQVRSIECKVRQTEKGIRVRCWPVLLTGIQVKDQTSEIQQHIGQAIATVTGIPVIGVSVKARYESLDKQPAEQVL